MRTMHASRRELMFGAAVLAMGAQAGIARAAAAGAFAPKGVKPLPLASFRLRPSDYATAVEVNRK